MLTARNKRVKMKWKCVIQNTLFSETLCNTTCGFVILFLCAQNTVSNLTITWCPACLWHWLFVSDSTILHRCDPEWGGEYCDEPVVPLPSQLKDSFSRAPSLSHWHILTGAKLSTVCGAVASGAALHFSGVNIHRPLLFDFSSSFLVSRYILTTFSIMKCSPTRDLVMDHKHQIKILFTFSIF